MDFKWLFDWTVVPKTQLSQLQQDKQTLTTSLQTCNTALKAAQLSPAECQKALASKEREASSLGAQVADLNVKLSLLSSEVAKRMDAGIPPASEAERYWNNKRPPVQVSYTCRTIPGTTTTLATDVRLFLQPQDYGIANWLSKKALSKINPDACDDAIMAIYRAHQQDFMIYMRPQPFGVAEYWDFPFETRARVSTGTGGVCHDFAVSLASTLEAAGVPYWRIRVTVGMSNSGEGHATTYVLADDLKTWRHLNSTSPAGAIPTLLSDLPKSNDSNDPFGIKTVWYSFSSKYCWSVFDTSAAEASWNASDVKNKVYIQKS